MNDTVAEKARNMGMSQSIADAAIAEFAEELGEMLAGCISSDFQHYQKSEVYGLTRRYAIEEHRADDALKAAFAQGWITRNNVGKTMEQSDEG